MQTIGEYAFYETVLDTMTLPNKLQTIGAMAFAGVRVTNVTIPATTITIGNGAFSSCSSLANLSFAEDSQLETIGDNAFYMSAITEVVLPDTVKYIGEGAFNSCSALTTLTIGAESELVEIGDMAFRYTAISGDVHIPSKLTTLGGSAFYGTGIKSIEIPESLTSIGEMAFADTDLVNVHIPNTVETMGTEVFILCDSLTKITYPARFRENIGNPGATTKISYEIREGNPATVSLQYDYVIGRTNVPATFLGMEVVEANLSGIEALPSKLIVSNKIKNASELQLPTGWTVVDEDIQKTFEPGESVEITAYCYPNYSYDALVFTCTVTRETCTNTEIRDERKATCKEVGYTGDTYCKDCEKLLRKGTEIPKDNNHTWDDGKVTKEATTTQEGERTYTCSICATTKVEKIDKLSQSGTQNDGKNEQQKEDTVPDDENKAIYKVIQKGMVQYVKPIKVSSKSVIIPATITVNGVKYKVTSIAPKAFKNNKRLTQITIGKYVTTIGNQAFYGCKKLKNITIKSSKLTNKKIGKNAFKKIKSNVKVKVPGKKIKSYKKILKKKGIGEKAKFIKG